MALTIGSTTGFNQALNIHTKKHDGKDAKLTVTDSGTTEDAQVVEDESPAALLQRFAASTDEMSVALTQFRNRRDLEKKTGAAAESSFDRVLDEDIHGKVDQIIKAVKGNIDVNINDLLRFVKSLFPDDSDLIFVLREMLRRHNLNKVIRGRLKHLLEHAAEQADAKKLKAGINVALKARLFGKTLDMSPGLMRESYRNFIESDLHEVLLYQEWIISYGAERRAIVVDFMESALTADIDALDPSCSHIEFGNLLSRIGQIKLLRSSDIAFVKSLINAPVVKELNTAEIDWVYLMLGILQHAASFEDAFTKIIRHRQRIRKEVLSQLLQCIYRACRQIPSQLFFDEFDKEVLEQELKRRAEETWLQELAERRCEIEQQDNNKEL